MDVPSERATRLAVDFGSGAAQAAVALALLGVVPARGGTSRALGVTMSLFGVCGRRCSSSTRRRRLAATTTRAFPQKKANDDEQSTRVRLEPSLAFVVKDQQRLRLYDARLVCALASISPLRFTSHTCVFPPKSPAATKHPSGSPARRRTSSPRRLWGRRTRRTFSRRTIPAMRAPDRRSTREPCGQCFPRRRRATRVGTPVSRFSSRRTRTPFTDAQWRLASRICRPARLSHTLNSHPELASKPLLEVTR